MVVCPSADYQSVSLGMNQCRTYSRAGDISPCRKEVIIWCKSMNCARCSGDIVTSDSYIHGSISEFCHRDSGKQTYAKECLCCLKIPCSEEMHSNGALEGSLRLWRREQWVVRWKWVSEFLRVDHSVSSLLRHAILMEPVHIILHVGLHSPCLTLSRLWRAHCIPPSASRLPPSSCPPRSLQALLA